MMLKLKFDGTKPNEAKTQFKASDKVSLADGNLIQSTTQVASPDPAIEPSAIASLADADYEFLFDQLSQGIAHGWHQRQIVMFFSRLGERGLSQLWIEWLERLPSKLTAAAPEYRRDMGTLLLGFGKLTQSTPEIGQIGAVASKIGHQLLFDRHSSVVWEYDGADVLATAVEREENNSNAIAETENLPQSVSKPDLDSERVLSLDGRSMPVRELVFEASPNPVSVDLAETRSSRQWRDRQPNSVETAAREPDTADSTKLNANIDAESQTVPSGKVVTGSVELVKNWFDLGIRQASAGKFDLAIASWEQALKLDDNLAEAWHNRGSALGHLGKYTEAVASFERSLVIDADNYRAWNGRAHALYLLQKWVEAASSWQKAIEIVPDNYLFWFNRACALERIKSYEESLVSYQKALKIKPDFQLARAKYLNLVRENSGTN